MVRVLFFGPLAEITRCTSIQMQGCADTEMLQQALYNQFPALANRKFAIAVNKTIVKEKTLLSAGFEVAFLPPFSGG